MIPGTQQYTDVYLPVCMMDITSSEEEYWRSLDFSHEEKLCCTLRNVKLLQDNCVGSSHFPAKLSLPCVFMCVYMYEYVLSSTGSLLIDMICTRPVLGVFRQHITTQASFVSTQSRSTPTYTRESIDTNIYTHTVPIGISPFDV